MYLQGFGKRVDPGVLVQQAENLALLERHLREVDALSKRKVGSELNETKVDQGARSMLFSDSGGDGDLQSGGGGGESAKDNPLSSMLIHEDELPMDARDSNLPQLQIQEQLSRVQDYKEQIDQGLDMFAEKLKRLHEMSLETGHELDEQNRIIDSIDDKVERETEKITQLNTRVQKATAETANSIRMLILAVFLIIIAVLLVAGGVYLVATFRPLDLDFLV